jgi:cytochrome b involved in lipid metabolism
MNAILCLVAVGLVICTIETITVKTKLNKRFEALEQTLVNELKKTKEELVKTNKEQLQGEIFKLAVTPIVVNLNGKKVDK